MEKLKYIKMSIAYLIILIMPSVIWAESKSQKVDVLMVTEQNVTKFIFTPDKMDIQTINQYIKSRHQILDRLALENPEQVLDAQISFRDYLNSKQITKIIRDYGVDVVTLNIGWKEQGGEYNIRQGESIEEALERANTHHRILIEELYESAYNEYQEKMNGGISEQEWQRLSGFLDHAIDLKNTFETYGVLYYGMRVKGKASKLKAIKDKDSNIRLVDPLWDEREKGLRGIYIIKKIGIPISPYHFND
jgi:hypothetical protein